MADAQGAGNASGATNPAAGPNLSLISTQLSWMRSDLSNLRTLLAWARTSVAMIGFGFTIYNFYRGFFEQTRHPRAAPMPRATWGWRWSPRARWRWWWAF